MSSIVSCLILQELAIKRLTTCVQSSFALNSKESSTHANAPLQIMLAGQGSGQMKQASESGALRSTPEVLAEIVNGFKGQPWHLLLMHKFFKANRNIAHKSVRNWSISCMEHAMKDWPSFDLRSKRMLAIRKSVARCTLPYTRNEDNKPARTYQNLLDIIFWTLRDCVEEDYHIGLEKDDRYGTTVDSLDLLHESWQDFVDELPEDEKEMKFCQKIDRWIDDVLESDLDKLHLVLKSNSFGVIKQLRTWLAKVNAPKSRACPTQ